MSDPTDGLPGDSPAVSDPISMPLEGGAGETSPDYAVGYRRPPIHAQFKKGQSGNPKGRPKASKNFKTDLLETLKTPIRVTQNGQQKTLSTQKAAMLQLREQALRGNPRALDRLLDFALKLNNDDATGTDASQRTQEDQTIFERYKSRLLDRRYSKTLAADLSAEPQTEAPADTAAAEKAAALGPASDAESAPDNGGNNGL